MKRETILAAGKLAYYDTFAGPVPCKVLSITTEPNAPEEHLSTPGSWHRVDIQLTADRGAYRKGEVVRDLWSLHVVPRGALRGNRILAYTVNA